MKLSFLSISKFYFDCTQGLFYKSKINSNGVYVVKTKTWSEGFYRSKNRRGTTVTSNLNSRESNDLNTYSIDNVIGNSNLPRINVHTERSSNELVTLQKENDIESSNIINEKNMDENSVSEEIASH